MNSLQEALTSTDVSLDDLEQNMLEYPQTVCPVEHYFGPSIYIRQVTMPKDTFVMGHAHKQASMNVMLQGKMAVLVDGTVRVIEAPATFVTPPGRKLAYIIEDVVFQNIYATDETDVDVLEDMFVDKSTSWETHKLENDATLLLSALHEGE